MSNVCMAERRTDNRVMTGLNVSSDVVVILPEGSHRPYLFPYSVDDRFLWYVLNSSCLCSVCDCKSPFQSLLKKEMLIWAERFAQWESCNEHSERRWRWKKEGDTLEMGGKKGRNV